MIPAPRAPIVQPRDPCADDDRRIEPAHLEEAFLEFYEGEGNGYESVDGTGPADRR